MARHLEALREADLPERKLPFWKMTGPAAVLVGLSIGAGELIIWPWITARFGATMIWAAALGVFIQLWVNLEIGRWTVATGESPYTGYARVWRGFVPLFILMNIVLMFLPGWARGSGVALRSLLFGPEGPGADWMWTAVTFAAIAALLFGPKLFYTAVERTIALLILIITVGMLYVFIRTANVDVLREFGGGLINVGEIQLAEDFPFISFFSAVVFAGAGGFGNLFYAYYLRDKQIGMGARIPRLMNPLRQEEEADITTGYIYPETEENQRRFRDWFMFVKQDQTLYFWLLNTFTMFLFMFGALAVLRPAGIVPSQATLVWDLATILEEVMGTFGRYLFLIIGMAALFSTQLVVVDGGARVFADLLHTNYERFRGVSQPKIYVAVAIASMVIGVFSVWVFESGITSFNTILYNALINGFAMALYVPAMLYVNLRFLPKSARPHLVNIVFVGAAAAIYVGFAVFAIYTIFLA